MIFLLLLIELGLVYKVFDFEVSVCFFSLVDGCIEVVGNFKILVFFSI